MRPTLYVDVDGVISLWGFPERARPRGSFVTVDGIAHYLSAEAGGHLRDLGDSFELVWCTGWEEKANDYLPRALGLHGPLSHLVLDGGAGPPGKRAAIDLHRRPGRPFAWIDDNHSPDGAPWAAAHDAPALLVTTDPATGLTEAEAGRLTAWAGRLRVPGPSGP